MSVHVIKPYLMSNRIIRFLREIYSSAITQELELQLFRALRQEMLEKNELLLRINETCDRIWFIEKGLFRSFRRNKGQEEDVWFMKEGDIMTSPRSFYSGKPGRHAIQALESSVVYSISKRQLDDIYERHPKFERIGRLLTEKYYLLSLDNWEELASGTVKARYHHFLRTYPGLDRRVPLKYIASFLKCSVRSLQRVRKKA